MTSPLSVLIQCSQELHQVTLNELQSEVATLKADAAELRAALEAIRNGLDNSNAIASLISGRSTTVESATTSRKGSCHYTALEPSGEERKGEGQRVGKEECIKLHNNSTY